MGETETKTNTRYNRSGIETYLKRNKVLPTKIGFKDCTLTDEDMELVKGHKFESVTLKDCHIPRLSMLPKSEQYVFKYSVIDEYDSLALTSEKRRLVKFDTCPTVIPHLKWLKDWFHMLFINDTPILTAEGLENVTLKYNNEIALMEYTYWDAFYVSTCTKGFVQSVLDHLPKGIVPDYDNMYLPVTKKTYLYADGDGVFATHCHIGAKDCVKLRNKLQKALSNIANGRLGENSLERI